MKEQYLYFWWVGIIRFINHHFKHEFVDSGLYVVQGENNFINPLLQVGSGSGFNEKVMDPDQTGQKSTDLTGSGSHPCKRHELFFKPYFNLGATNSGCTLSIEQNTQKGYAKTPPPT